MSTKISDQELIESAIEGNGSAHTELYGRYSAPITNYISFMVRQKEDQEDIAIKTLTKAFEKLGDYDPMKGKFSTWVYTIATRMSIDHIRSITRKKFLKEAIEIDDESKFIPLKSKNLSPEDILILKELYTECTTVINGLNNSQKTLVKARLYEDKSYQEISDSYNLSLGTVKANLHRANDMLRRKTDLTIKNLRSIKNVLDGLAV